MILHQLPRLFAGSLLIVGLLLSLPGCGEKPPADKGQKKDEPGPTPPTGGDPKGTAKNEPRPPEKVSPEIEKAATDFLKSLVEGNAKASSLSTGFVKAIGLPVELPSDKAKGYSDTAAEVWLRRVGTGVNFSPPFEPKQAGDVALFRGSFMGPGKTGNYALRMVKEADGWKADWLSLSSANTTSAALPGSDANALFQHFAAASLAQIICDKDGMAQGERAALLAAGFTPALRQKLAEPFGSDKDKGFDYNAGKLALEVAKIGGGAESITVVPAGDAFNVEVTKAGGAKSMFTLKLVKGTTPGQWLVESITP